MKIKYIEKNFRANALDLIQIVNGIIDEYQAKGFSLTVRQIYYQLVARDYIPNKQKEYKRVGNIISEARKAGLISWDAIEDRTRELRGNQHWHSPEQIVKAAVNSYKINKWENQPYVPEVWIEKDALVGVIARICQQLDVAYFSSRGYGSISEIHKAGHDRMRRYISKGQTPVIIQLGDHDPSGIDITRDIQDRLAMFSRHDVWVERIALNRDQIEQFNPPPNFTKLTDSRAGGYIQLYGYQSWELDALEPEVMEDLIRSTVLNLRDEDLWQESLAREEEDKDQLREWERMAGI